MDSEHDLYVDFLDIEMKKAYGAKVNVTDLTKGIVKILDTIMKGEGRKFVFMYPSVKGNAITITIRDIHNDMASCVVIEFTKSAHHIRFIKSSSKYGKCTRTKAFTPHNPRTVHKLSNTLSPIMATKIASNVYKNFPIA